MKKLKFKSVMRWDTIMRMLRLFRIVWETGTRGKQGWYSCKLTVAFKLPWAYQGFFYWRRCSMPQEFVLVLCGLRIHYLRSYGGCFV